jgi:Flp pilus assembly CpaF family ATPase
MVTFLEACVAGRVNVLVAGSGATGLVGALANAAAAGDRVAVVSDVEDVIVPHAHVTQVTMVDARERGRDAVRGAARLHADRLVVTRLTGLGAAAVVEAVADGASGVLAASQAPSLRQATARLASQLVLSGGGISIDSARDAVAEAFDIAIECTRGADGRDRVQRIAEVVGTDPKGVVLKDIFTCDDTGFTATGIVPKIAAELGQRGVKVDGGVFKRR